MKIELDIIELSDYTQFIGNEMFELPNLELSFNMDRMTKIDFTRLLEILDRINTKKNREIPISKTLLNGKNLGTISTFIKRYFDIKDKISRRMVRKVYELLSTFNLVYTGYNRIVRTEAGKRISKFVDGKLMWNMVELESILLVGDISRHFSDLYKEK
jgi:hypothetical protein